jgi:hypothetical protein
LEERRGLLPKNERRGNKYPFINLLTEVKESCSRQGRQGRKSAIAVLFVEITYYGAPILYDFVPLHQHRASFVVSPGQRCKLGLGESGTSNFKLYLGGY